jgi:uncharacterized protein (TIGR00255 family)
MEFRQLVNMKGIRGKFDLTLTQYGEQDEAYELDTEQFKSFYNQLQSLSQELGFKEGDIAQTIIRIPSVLNVAEEKLGESSINAAKQAIEKALDELIGFRKKEGEAMAEDLISNSSSIEDKLDKIAPHEKARKEYVRERLWNQLSERFKNDEVDKVRYEQEVLYYLEKLDISEERVRLQQHCNYFREQVMNEDDENGRKLNFISQEMGREINTMGAKANNSDIQHLVVRMKEDLEKIKEQVANIV